ncbi:MAG: hypothetical protein AB1752_08595 [Candidatus Zixiibacteriota bacterium]
MSFLNRHKATVALSAAFVLIAGGAYLSGSVGCGSSCALTSLFTVSDAVAGPGCSAEASKTGSACTGSATAKTANAEAAKSCDKDACISKLMAEKGLTRAQAEAAFAATCTDTKKAEVTTASATGAACCASKANATTASATLTDAEQKEACIAKCMAEKGFTREEAEKCYTINAAQKASGQESSCHAGVNMIQTANATEGKTHSREACIDACVAKGMTKAEAEACADKCRFHAEAHKANAEHSCAATCAAHKASTEGSTTNTAPSGGTK